MEDEIHFKNQEIKEFVAEIKCKDEKIRRLETLCLHLEPQEEDVLKGEDILKETERVWREKLQTQAVTNTQLEERLKLQVTTHRMRPLK